MADEIVEREFMGRGRGKIWTYLIALLAMVALVVIVNLVWKDPSSAQHGLKSFMGLPSWALCTITFLLGAIIFWAGLKIETDWPEGVGAFLIATSVAWAELIIGWHHFALGGLFVLPYLLPIAVFGVLLMYGMKKST